MNMTERPDTIPAEAFRFMEDLAAQNTKAFFEAHRDRFQHDVKAPFAALLGALEACGEGPFKTYRIHRDIRFSADKSPYKTIHGAIDGTGHRYLHIAADGLLVAAGAYVFDKNALKQYRALVADDRFGPMLERIVAELASRGIDVEPGGATPLKTAPRGVDPGHPRIGLLRHKGLVAMRHLPARPRKIGEAAAEAADFWKTCAPLCNWLERTRGPR